MLRERTFDDYLHEVRMRSQELIDFWRQACSRRSAPRVGEFACTSASDPVRLSALRRCRRVPLVDGGNRTAVFAYDYHSSTSIRQLAVASVEMVSPTQPSGLEA
jgi:hypothetical protein